jgi:hypothetical protein
VRASSGWTRPLGILAIGLLGFAIVLAGCGSTGAPAPTLDPSLVGPSALPAVPALTSPVEGVVIAVDSAGLDKVTGFTVRLADGAEVPFTIGTLENGVKFPPGHLTEHVVSAEPIRVFFRPQGSALVVYRIEDAG